MQFKFISSCYTQLIKDKMYHSSCIVVIMYHLNTFIISLSERLYFNIGSLSCCNLSTYGRCFKEIINFVAFYTLIVVNQCTKRLLQCYKANVFTFSFNNSSLIKISTYV